MGRERESVCVSETDRESERVRECVCVWWPDTGFSLIKEYRQKSLLKVLNITVVMLKYIKTDFTLVSI